LRKWLDEASPYLDFDHEGNERWMDTIGQRVEKGMSKSDIVINPAKMPHRLLEDLIYDDYLDWIYWLVCCVESGPEKIGTFAEFSQNDFLTKHACRKRKITSGLLRAKKRLKVTNNAESSGYLEMPDLEKE
jgi:hypothetical protein